MFLQVHGLGRVLRLHGLVKSLLMCKFPDLNLRRSMGAKNAVLDVLLPTTLLKFEADDISNI